MEIRFQRIFLACLLSMLSAISSNAVAASSLNDLMSIQVVTFANDDQQNDGAQQDETLSANIERREVIDDLLDDENFEFGVQFGLISIEDFESNLWLSGHFSYHINEYFYAKALYGYSEAGITSFETLANVPPLLTDEERKLRYYGLNVGYNLMPGEVFLSKDLAFNSMFSIEIGGGSTEFAGSNQFTVNFTANYRLYLTDAITWDIGMSDYVFDTTITGKSKTTHNLNLTTGFSYYF